MVKCPKDLCNKKPWLFRQYLEDFLVDLVHKEGNYRKNGLHQWKECPKRLILGIVFLRNTAKKGGIKDFPL